MEPVLGHIQVSRTARYFMLGNNKIRPREVIFVLHGYGMPAAAFIMEFTGIASENRWIVAPEGLSRFYRKGFAGEVVASWMTKEDRIHEIRDYIDYLDQLYLKLITGPDVRIMVIGFSQGAATASRWVMNGNSKVDDLVIWSGDFAPDIERIPGKKPVIRHVMSSSDEFITPERMQEQSKRLLSFGFDVREYQFEGGHSIHQETLSRLVSDFRSRK